MRTKPKWRDTTLSELIGRIEVGVSVQCDNRPKQDGEYGVLKTSAVGTGIFDPTQHKAALPEEISRLRVNVRSGSIIICRSNTPDLVGTSAFIAKEFPDLYLPDTLWQTAEHNSSIVNVRWLAHYFNSMMFREQIDSIASGTSANMKKVSQKNFMNLVIPLPPLHEQRAIAAILSTWDEAITLTTRLIDALQRRKQALMQLLLTGEVRFPGFDEAWEEVEIRHIGNVFSGGTPDTGNSTFWDGDIPWCTPSEITSLKSKFISKTERQITEAGLKNSSAILLPPYSVLVCTRATVGDAAINTIEMATNQGFKNIVPFEDYSAEFIFYSLQIIRHVLVRLANGSTFLELSKQAFESIQISTPSYSEQTQIAQFLGSCDKELETLVVLIGHLVTQKRGLMQQLLSGAVRVENS